MTGWRLGQDWHRKVNHHLIPLLACNRWKYESKSKTQLIVHKKVNHANRIVAKKWEPGNLVPSRFSGQIRKVEARLGKLAKIRKVETD